MEQESFLEANSSSASQEIPCILWNQKVRQHFHKSPPLVSILSQKNPGQLLRPPSILQIKFEINFKMLGNTLAQAFTYVMWARHCVVYGH
jgi:hypothetical protein